MTLKIQYITFPPCNINDFPDITVKSFDNFCSLDSFDYNFININTSNSLNYYTNGVFMNENDFKSLKINMDENKNCKIIIILPQNLKNSKGYYIKDRLNCVYDFLNKFLNMDQIKLIYGRTITLLNNYEFFSDFYMDILSEYEILSKNNNGKTTTIKHENKIYTTLKISSQQDIFEFLNSFLKNNEQNIPDWFDEIEMFDDKIQRERINKNDLKIEELNKDNNQAQDILNSNNEYKSILYKQATPLVKSVFKILEDMLDYDLSTFIDTFKEDFLIKFEDVTFIGEIKGVSRNVTKSHLSQTDDHVTEREDLLDEKGESENLQPLLIINRFLNLPPSERPEVDKTTIKKAEEKYEILIITTEELLKLYEYYKNGNITSEKIIERFKNEIGLFKL